MLQRLDGNANAAFCSADSKFENMQTDVVKFTPLPPALVIAKKHKELLSGAEKINAFCFTSNCLGGEKMGMRVLNIYIAESGTKQTMFYCMYTCT